MDVAIETRSSQSGGGSDAGLENEFLGFIDEGEVIRALERRGNLQRVTAEDIMNTALLGWLAEVADGWLDLRIQAWSMTSFGRR